MCFKLANRRQRLIEINAITELEKLYHALDTFLS